MKIEDNLTNLVDECLSDYKEIKYKSHKNDQKINDISKLQHIQSSADIKGLHNIILNKILKAKTHLYKEINTSLDIHKTVIELNKYFPSSRSKIIINRKSQYINLLQSYNNNNLIKLKIDKQSISEKPKHKPSKPHIHLDIYDKERNFFINLHILLKAPVNSKSFTKHIASLNKTKDGKNISIKDLQKTFKIGKRKPRTIKKHSR